MAMIVVVIERYAALLSDLGGVSAIMDYRWCAEGWPLSLIMANRSWILVSDEVKSDGTLLVVAARFAVAMDSQFDWMLPDLLRRGWMLQCSDRITAGGRPIQVGRCGDAAAGAIEDEDMPARLHGCRRFCSVCCRLDRRKALLAADAATVRLLSLGVQSRQAVIWVPDFEIDEGATAGSCCCSDFVRCCDDWPDLGTKLPDLEDPTDGFHAAVDAILLKMKGSSLPVGIDA
ncbi:hypothetical protein ACLOJK_022589 [Asimina triloba]